MNKTKTIPAYQKCPRCAKPQKTYSLKQLDQKRKEGIIKKSMFRCETCKQSIFVESDLRIRKPTDEERGKKSTTKKLGNAVRLALSRNRFDNTVLIDQLDQPLPSFGGETTISDANKTVASQWGHEPKIQELLQQSIDIVLNAIAKNEVLAERYVLSKVIGQGATGIVAICRDIIEEKDVAAKFHLETIIPSEDGDLARRRVERTFQLQSSIHSEYSVTPITIIKHQQYGFIAIEEYVEGVTLGTVIKAGETLKEESAIRIASQLARVLIEAQSQGEIIHRDIKPENLMITEDPEKGIKAVLVDYGSCRSNTQDRRDHTGLFGNEFSSDDEAAISESLTVAGMIIGTPLYMAPEQIIGGRLDSRTDLYGLAATMYHAVTGQTLFDALNIPELLEMVVHKSPIPASRAARLVDKKVSKRFSKFLSKALKKDPEKRHKSPISFLAALEKCSEPETPSKWEFFKSYIPDQVLSFFQDD